MEVYSMEEKAFYTEEANECLANATLRNDDNIVVITPQKQQHQKHIKACIISKLFEYGIFLLIVLFIFLIWYLPELIILH